jgi:hypothetical protein
MRNTILIILLPLQLLGCSSTAPPASHSAEVEAISFVITDERIGPMRSLQAKTEPAVARCMKRQGFTYIAQPTMPDPANPSDGFGFVEALLSSQNDPNREIRTALPLVERRAYDKALLGIQSDRVDNVVGGCVKDALYGGTSDSGVVKLFDDIGQMEKQLLANEEMRRIRSNWSRCMKIAGYENLGSRADILLKVLNPEYSKFLASASSSGLSDPDIALLRDLETKLSRVDTDCSKRDSTEELAIRKKYRDKLISGNVSVLNEMARQSR